jgi:hypothetical protein
MEPANSEKNNRCQPGLVKWHADTQIASSTAQESQKLILLFHMLGRLDEQMCCANARLARIMLFSNETIADYINTNFEPVWQSLRAAPVVSIDFGKGYVLRRAMPGNIVTYVCAPDGQVMDILPGMYAPDGYLAQLKWFQSLHWIAALPVEKRQPALFDYHADAVKRILMRPAFDTAQTHVKIHTPYGGGGTTILAQGPKKEQAPTKPDLPEVPPGVEGLTLDQATQFQALVEDTKHNEPARRTAIHEKLAKSRSVNADGIVKWLYREVLNTDLDDPYLGIGSDSV